MKARAFLEIAHELANNDSVNPAKYRTAISRSYYAAYHELAGLSTSFGIVFSNGPNCHQQVESLLNNTKIQTLNNVSAKYHQLKRMRRLSDYNLDNIESESKIQAILFVKISTSIITVVDLLRSNQKDMEFAKTAVLQAAAYLQIQMK